MKPRLTDRKKTAKFEDYDFEEPAPPGEAGLFKNRKAPAGGSRMKRPFGYVYTSKDIVFYVIINYQVLIRFSGRIGESSICKTL